MWSLDGHGLLLWQYYQMTMHLELFHLIWYGYNLIILWLLDNSVIFLIIGYDITKYHCLLILK